MIENVVYGAKISPSEAKRTFCIQDGSKTPHVVNFNIVGGKVCCYTDGSEFDEEQIVLISNCCFSAIKKNPLLDFVEKNEKCPACDSYLDPKKFVFKI